MVRVLFYIGVCLLAVSAALLYLPTCFLVIIAGLSLVGFIVALFFKRRIALKHLPLLFIAVFIFTVYGTLVLQLQVAPAEALAGHSAEITGTVSARPERYDGYSVYYIQTESIRLEDASAPPPAQELKLRLSDVNGLDLKIYDKATLKIAFKPLEDFKRSSLSNGVYAGGYVEELVARLGEERPFLAIFEDLHNAINERLYQSINYDEASVISAILLGDKENLTDDFVTDSRVTGVTHVLVVSGGHLGIIFQLLSYLFAFIKLKRLPANLLLLASVFALEALCGFSPSILRAGLTYVIMTVGMIFFKKADPLNSLGGAVIIILFTSPFGFGNMALLLSVLSTFGLLWLCPILYNSVISLWSKALPAPIPIKAFFLTLCQTVAAIIATMPVCILGIGYVSLIAPVTNLLIGYAVNLLTSLTFITVILLFLPNIFKGLATLPIIILVMLVRYIVYITDLTARFEYALLPAVGGYLAVLLIPLLIPILNAAAGKFLNTTALMRTRIKKSVCIGVSLATLLTAVTVFMTAPKNFLSVPDLGKGGGICLTVNDMTLAVGSGDTADDADKIEAAFLKTAERDIDYLILPSCDKRFAGGAVSLTRHHKGCTLLYPKGEERHAEYLAHLNESNFVPYDAGITFEKNEIRVTACKNSGVVVNFEDCDIILFVGGGNIKQLYSLCKNDKIILAAFEELPDELDKRIDKIFIGGANAQQMGRRLATFNRSYTVAGATATIEI